jgi:hypothetical protein
MSTRTKQPERTYADVARKLGTFPEGTLRMGKPASMKRPDGNYDVVLPFTYSANLFDKPKSAGLNTSAKI